MRDELDHLDHLDHLNQLTEADERALQIATDRYSACLVGRPLPPLDTWN
jgi:hypothetical protein